MYNLSKIYKISGGLTFWSSRENVALKGVSFYSKKGEIMAILGQNGAGKTTMINILTTRLLKSSGKVNVFGYDLVADREKVRSIVSLCPQFDIYWPELTVEEHVKLFSKLRGVECAHIDEYVAEKIEEVGLTPRTEFRIKYLSGGMKRRLSIALSTIGNPKVIFLDEPTTGLDPVT